MIDPNDVDLIIFDMDGTIVPSLPAVYEAIKRTFVRLGWPVTFSAADINKFFGLPSASTSGSGLYQFVTPAGSHLSWTEVRDRVREEYEGCFREMTQTFPGVRETLKTLRERGYKLALYTNSSTRYCDMVITTLNMRQYFDYLECIQENNLTKPELVRKIREKLGGATTAVVGDRCHDVEAARETGSLSVGVLFGYGGKEPEEADTTINSFDELLSIFDRRLPVFERILTEVNKRKSKGKSFVIGINGIDGAGKTKFSDSLERYLNSKDCETRMIHLDDFHNPRAFRYAGKEQVENYYHRSFNTGLIVRELLLPLHQKSTFSTRLTLLDLHTDKYEVEKEFSFSKNSIVIFEGVFLFRKELATYIDYKIFLEIPFEESKRRARVKDAKVSRAELKKYDEKYLPAQAKYLAEYPPSDVADMIIDNTDWEFPRIKFSR